MVRGMFLQEGSKKALVYNWKTLKMIYRNVSMNRIGICLFHSCIK